ncbi:MAG: MYG1 family protein [Rhodobacteraceae bacterium]|nr:MYG1 family protein [Paracoccaceae bacterium]
MTITHLVTHSGGFHTDELLSSVVLTRLFHQAELLRRRDKQWTTSSAGNIVFEVTGAYDAEVQVFDLYQCPDPMPENGQRPLKIMCSVRHHYAKVMLKLPEFCD